MEDRLNASELITIEFSLRNDIKSINKKILDADDKNRDAVRTFVSESIKERIDLLKKIVKIRQRMIPCPTMYLWWGVFVGITYLLN